MLAVETFESQIRKMSTSHEVCLSSGLIEIGLATRKKGKNQYKGKPNCFKSGRCEHCNHTGFSSEAQKLLWRNMFLNAC